MYAEPPHITGRKYVVVLKLIEIIQTFIKCMETPVYFLFCVICLDSNAAAYMDENLANFFTA